MSLPITPETRIGALLEAYPTSESALIAMAPAFANLSNPVLRKTVARVATIEQAAKIGGVSLPDMLRKIREAAGQGDPVPPATGDAGWLMDCHVVKEVDADSMLSGGEHPIGVIREGVAALEAGEVILLRSSFRPQPLIETLRRSGAAVHSSTRDGLHLTWFGHQRVQEPSSIRKAYP